jgi:hypothetical protein
VLLLQQLPLLLLSLILLLQALLQLLLALRASARGPGLHRVEEQR